MLLSSILGIKREVEAMIWALSFFGIVVMVVWFFFATREPEQYIDGVTT